MGTFFQNVHFWGCEIFYHPVVIQFSMAVRIYKVHVFEKNFLLNYQDGDSQQTFQGEDMLRGTLTNKHAWHLNWVVLWGQINETNEANLTNKIHISIAKRSMDTKIGKALIQCKKLPNMTLWSSDQREVTWLFEKSASPLS